MADEITIQSRLKVVKGNLSFDRNVSDTFDMSGTHLAYNVKSIPTTAGGTALDINTSVATLGYAFFRNLDTTNYVTVGIVVSATYYPVLKLKAGECGVIRLATGITPYALANTGAVNLEYGIAED